LLGRHLTQLDKVKFVKKLFGENDVEIVLQRLDRLTQDEARATAAQTLVVVYGLVQNMRAVMDGEKMLLSLFLIQCWTSLLLDSKVSADSIREALRRLPRSE